MLNLLNTEFYKLFHSRYFWGIVAFNLFLSSVLLLDSIGETSSLFFASLYNVPILFFLAIVFSALFVGNDFGQRTLQSYIIAGHNRGQILLAKLIAYQIACITILALPLLVHGLIGRLCFKESFVSVSGNLYTVLAVVVSLFAMCLLPFFFALLFRDIGKTYVRLFNEGDPINFNAILCRTPQELYTALANDLETEIQISLGID